MTAPPLIDVQGLTVKSGDATLVDGVSLQLHRGECIGLVGESGSGKSLTLRALIDLLPPRLTSTAVRPQATPNPVAPRIGMIFQDPSRALNPRRRIHRVIEDTLRLNTKLDATQRRERTHELLQEVGLRDTRGIARAYPHQISGGQRQRALIAASLAAEPDVLLCDEPTTALDVTSQAEVIALLRHLLEARNMAAVFVSHDLAVVAEIATSICVMYCGQIVERGATADVLDAPRHHYTRGLVDSIPTLSGPRQELTGIPGIAPRAGERSPACRFIDRCGSRQPDCAAAPIPLPDDTRRHVWRCLHPTAEAR